MAIAANFTPANGLLTAFGTSGQNTIKFGRDPAGNILVNDGTVAVLGGTPTVANTSLIQAFGQAGNDTITLDETNGALPAAQLFGGDGNDAITGGSGNDLLVRSERQRHAAWSGRQRLAVRRRRQRCADRRHRQRPGVRSGR